VTRIEDRWHKMLVDDNGVSLKHPLGCPTYPDGPEYGDTAYGCLTCAVLTYHETDHSGLYLHGQGEYRIRYWYEKPSSGQVTAEGFDVEVVEQ
jgi:hypothetical protein